MRPAGLGLLWPADRDRGEKKWGKVGTRLDAVEFRQKCREFAEEQINIQRVDFKRLGVTGDWDNRTRP